MTTPAPAVVLLQGDPEAGVTDVVVHVAGRPYASRTIGHIDHAPGSARRAMTVSWHGTLTTLVIVSERDSVHGSTYNSALYRVSSGRAVRLVGDITDLSAPLVTEHGTVLVQRGADGVEPPLTENGPRLLRERMDTLHIDAVDLDTGTTRRVWSGDGQIAYLAAPMRNDEFCVYRVSDAGGSLFAIDARTSVQRSLLDSFPPLARDFSFDPQRNEIVFARAQRFASDVYEIAALRADGSQSVRVIHEAASDRMQPRRLHDGAIAFSSANDHGLALSTGSGAQPTSFARLGEGTDAALGESADGAWLAIRHTAGHSQSLALVERRSGTAISISSPHALTEFAGFVPDGVAP
jgi:hypothetical protein